MATRLTGFSKFLIVALIIALIVFAGRWVMNNTGLGDKIEDARDNAKAKVEQDDSAAEGASSTAPVFNGKSTRDKNDNTLRVQLVTWGGYAPGLYFNEGAKANLQSRFYKEYGFKVDFVLNNDLINAMDAWIAGEYDVLVQTADAFPLYTAAPDINALNPKIFMQVDWSRGGDAIIVKRGINTINDLKGKKVAVTVPSPSQTLLISSLEAAGLSYNDVEVIKTQDNFKAAELFKAGEVDAAVVWSPDDIFATQAVPGSKTLLTTQQESHIIADIFFAKMDFINENREMINNFYEGWMKGVKELQNKGNQKKAAKYLGELNSISTDDALGMMSTVYWTNHGDNMNFFGLNRGFKGQTGEKLYSKMAKKFVQTGDVEKVAPNWRSVIYTPAVMNGNTKLKGASYGAEKGKEFKKSAADINAAPIASKPVSINFASGQSTLSENAKTIIDLQFGEVARTFGNTKVRIEGNTDSVGGRDMNIRLSKKRAQAVANYLVKEYGLNPNRFVIVGNGPDKPVKGCESNATSACKAKNRRTDFNLIGG